MAEQYYLDVDGLHLYDTLIKNFIEENKVKLTEMKLTDENVLELYYKDGEKLMKLPINLSSLSSCAEWVEL